MPPKDFSELSDAEAQAFFEQYVTTAPERLEAFRREVAATGGPALDGDVESLGPLWQWFAPRARAWDGAPAGELPAWYEPDAPELAGRRLASSTLRDVDGLALYLAEVFRGSVPGLEWGVAKAAPGLQDEAHNRPVLQREDVDIDVLAVAYSLAVRAGLGVGPAPGPETLLDTYRAWADPLGAVR